MNEVESLEAFNKLRAPFCEWSIITAEDLQWIEYYMSQGQCHHHYHTEQYNAHKIDFEWEREL